MSRECRFVYFERSFIAVFPSEWDDWLGFLSTVGHLLLGEGSNKTLIATYAKEKFELTISLTHVRNEFFKVIQMKKELNSQIRPRIVRELVRMLTIVFVFQA